LRFVIDGQLPPWLAHQLRLLGHDAVHIEDVGLRGDKDTSIWRYAVVERRVVITKDEDFATLVNRTGETPVLWIRLGNTNNQALWAALVAIMPQVVSAFESGERLIEVR
jgi:predicted nuclease of predicted toxin-antitoxin system